MSAPLFEFVVVTLFLQQCVNSVCKVYIFKAVLFIFRVIIRVDTADVLSLSG